MEKFNTKKSGFTLIEMLVVVGVFSGLVTLISGIFVANFEIQRKTLAVQKSIEELSYSVEYMSKAIRMAQKDVEGECGDIPQGNTYHTYYDIGSGRGIQFISYEGECLEFFWDEAEGVLKKVNHDEGEEYDLTSDMLEVGSFQVEVLEDEDDYPQPSVTFLLEVEEDQLQEWETVVQTTATRRRLEIEEADFSL